MDVIQQRKTVLDIICFAFLSTIPMYAGMYNGLIREVTLQRRQWEASFLNQDIAQVLHHDILLLLFPSFASLAALVALLYLDFRILSRPRKPVPAEQSKEALSSRRGSRERETIQANWYTIRFVVVLGTAGFIGVMGLAGGATTGRDIFVYSLLALSAIALIYVRIRHQLVWQWIHLSQDGGSHG